MSVINQTNKVYGSGNGITTTFSFAFKIFDVSEMYVYTIVAATGAVTGPLTYTTDYTIAISSVTEGGTVTFVVPPPTGTNWFLKRIVPQTQSASIPSEGVFPGKQFENQLDLLTMMAIQTNEAVTRALVFPPTYTGTISTLPNPVAGLALGWDVLGNITNISIGGGGLAVPIADSNLQTIVTAGKVNGSALTGLANIPSGAGIIPIVNIPTGTTANKVVALDGLAKLPAVDGSALLNLPGTKIKLIQISKGMTEASVSTAYTGVGFTPKALIAIGTIAGTNAMTWGLADASTNNCTPTGVQGTNNQSDVDNGHLIAVYTGTNAYQRGALVSLDVDGFTISWAKLGSPTGTLVVNVLCIG